MDARDSSAGASTLIAGSGLCPGTAREAPEAAASEATGRPLGCSRSPVAHPQKWTEEQVRAWWEQRTRRLRDVMPLSKGTDGRNIMRWPVARFEQMCGGNGIVASALYQDLRLEIERADQRRRGLPPPLEIKPPAVLVEEARRQQRPPSVKRDAGSGGRRATRDETPSRTTRTPMRPAPRSPTPTRGPKPATPAALSSAAPAPRASSPVPRFAFSPTRRRSPEPASTPASRHRSPQPQPVQASAPSRPPRTMTSLKARPAAREHASTVVAATPASAAAMPAAAAIPALAGNGRSTPRPDRKGKTGSFSHAELRTASPPVAMLSRCQTAAPTVRKGAGNRPGPLPPAPQEVATARTVRREVKKPGQFPAKSASPPVVGGAPKIRRSLVMEDLGDETLSQVGLRKSPGPRRPAVIATGSKKLPMRATQDDSELLSAVGPRKPLMRAVARDDCELANAGVADDSAPTRRMFDKRELRRQYKNAFEQQLELWRTQHMDGSSPVVVPAPACDAAASKVRVCVRKRPLFDYERAAEEFDVVSVRNGSEVFMHNCLTKADLKSLFISHMGFSFASAFNEVVSDDEVYERCAAQAVRHAQDGGVATLFMFGQTGSGKTHTMAGLLRRAAAQLFDECGNMDCSSESPRSPRNSSSPRSLGRSRSPIRSKRFYLEAFEIAGKTMRDLLGSGAELKVMEDRDHRTRVLGGATVEVTCAEDLLERIQDAQSRRSTRATQANDTSSRSHAVIRLWPGINEILIGSPRQKTSAENSSEYKANGALLTFVDCAGTERREDSTHHDVRTRKDAAEINATLFALKECFRVLRAPRGGQQPPFRESLLTRVLSDSFVSENARVVAVGTVSPSATDTEHSIATLRALQGLQGTQAAFESREDVATRPAKHVEPHPRLWTEAEVRRWMESLTGDRWQALAAEFTNGTDGRLIVRWPAQRFAALCGGEESLGSLLYKDLRQRIRAASGGA